MNGDASHETLDTWLARGDLDELIREVDRRADRHDWHGVEEVARRSRAAIERGHQLWPAASFAEYRIALGAPAEIAASVVREGAGWMAPGPLAEVVAQDHTFSDLCTHLEVGPLAAVVAGERVLRGEEIADDQPVAGELPGRLLDWEPRYLLASYAPDGFRFDTPEVADPTRMQTVELEALDAAAMADPDALDAASALHGAVAHWATRSAGTVRVSGVAGNHVDALAALGLTEARWREATPSEFATVLAWAAADGAANGRRRGAAAGRSELWWCLVTLCGLDEQWPCDPGSDAAELRFGLWLPTEPVTGWSCRLTVEDPLDGLAWALDASETAIETAIEVDRPI